MLPKKKNLEEERAKHTVDSLYKDYVDDLFSYALGFGFDKQTAMDAIHDVFCRVCIREREVQEIQNPKFYLLRALRNQLIDTYKLKRNYSEVLTGEITDELPYKIKITDIYSVYICSIFFCCKVNFKFHPVKTVKSIFPGGIETCLCFKIELPVFKVYAQKFFCVFPSAQL